MNLQTRDKALRAALEDDSASRRRFGAEMAKKLRLRLDALTAAESLADLWPPNSGPERCHELKGELNGIFSIDLKQPYRLLFRPIEKDVQKDRSDEHQRWKSITAIELLRIEDTHG